MTPCAASAAAPRKSSAAAAARRRADGGRCRPAPAGVPVFDRTTTPTCVPRVEADERAIAAGAAVVPDDLAAGRLVARASRGRSRCLRPASAAAPPASSQTPAVERRLALTRSPRRGKSACRSPSSAARPPRRASAGPSSRAARAAASWPAARRVFISGVSVMRGALHAQRPGDARAHERLVVHAGAPRQRVTEQTGAEVRVLVLARRCRAAS